MFHYTDEPRFTIEQIDLLQRLRRTGMTRHEILHALETFDRLDQEHSDKFGRRSAYGASGGSCSNSTNNVAASSSTATASTQTQHSGMSPSPSNSYDTSPQPCTTNQNGRESSERLSAFNGKMSPTRYPLASSMAQRSYSFEASEEDLDVDDKVEELMSSVIKEEIKAFLANRRISQAVVAQVTGKSSETPSSPPRPPTPLHSSAPPSRRLLLPAQMLGYRLAFCIAVQICQLSHDNVCL
nr:homeobox-containing protein 1-like isoform X2 [Zootoca vivipara]